MHHMDITRTMTVSPDTAKKAKLTERERLVLEVAKQAAVGMRRAAASHNIHRMREFVDAMTFAGLLVQKNAPETDAAAPAPDFASIIEQKADAFRRVIETRQLKGTEDALEQMKGKIGIIDQKPSHMIVSLGLNAENIVGEVARSYGLSKAESMQTLVFAMVLATMASTPAEELDDEINALVLEASDKIEHWDSFIPSDEEMFGDIDWGDEDEGDGEDDPGDGSTPT